MQANQDESRGSWAWPILLAVMIFMASGRGQIAAPDIVSIDKVGHFLVFGLLGALIARTQPRRRWWLGVFVASLYGISDEFRQSFTPGRAVEVADWVADTLGALLSVTLYCRWTFYRRVLEQKLWGKSSAPVANRDQPVCESAG
jgi:VanZ family protein